MSEFKVGDRVWVLCKVIDPCENLIKVTGSGNDNWFWAGGGQCRPVESPAVPDLSTMGVEVVSDLGSQVVKPPAKEPTPGQKLAEQALKGIWAANDSVNETPVVKDSFTTESNSPEIPDSSSDPLQVGDSVRFVSPGHKRHGTEGVLKSIHHGPKNAYFFISNCGQFHRYCTASELEQIDKLDPINPSHYKQFVIVNDNDGNQTLYVDGVLMEGDNTVYGCDIDQAAKGCTIKIESRDVDFIVEHWPLRLSDLSIEKQPETNPLAPSSCMDGVNVDEFAEGIMETRGRASDPINPSHYKQGGIECIEAIRAALGDGFPDYLRGNVMKYLWRYKEKGGVEDLKKARWYLDRLIKEVGK